LISLTFSFETAEDGLNKMQAGYGHMGKFISLLLRITLSPSLLFPALRGKKIYLLNINNIS